MTAVKERPILFSAPMVRAILSGAKTQTRRVVRDQPPAHMNSAVPYLKPDDGPQQWCFTGPQLDAAGKPLPIEQWEGGWPDCSPAFVCPHGDPGSHLWVRETWGVGSRPDPWGGYDGIEYRADEGFLDPNEKYPTLDCCRVEAPEGVCLGDYRSGWKPSIHMPRWASRITLELTDVRVQRVQEISEEDAQSEGAEYLEHCGTYRKGEPIPASYRYGFQHLWDSINADRGFGWDKDPWVWALTFRRLP